MTGATISHNLTSAKSRRCASPIASNTAKAPINNPKLQNFAHPFPPERKTIAEIKIIIKKKGRTQNWKGNEKKEKKEGISQSSPVNLFPENAAPPRTSLLPLASRLESAVYSGNEIVSPSSPPPLPSLHFTSLRHATE
ncbi:hypothetical protein NPIL_74371 [Nephila pilipes]|uniref:Uncharacterized protein n=1 Tax=Nephila pilipes TaxID=299642 RepID=A0A8X6PTY5_NEPPI|nr:hypothetical protein NPIL_74371 [Nephila pilipes]